MEPTETGWYFATCKKRRVRFLFYVKYTQIKGNVKLRAMEALGNFGYSNLDKFYDWSERIIDPGPAKAPETKAAPAS